jgi:phosphoglycolate phosphatase
MVHPASAIQGSTLAIFDLDGTLISVFDFHARSLDRVANKLWGISNKVPIRERFGIPQRETLRRLCEIGGISRSQYERDLSTAVQELALAMSTALPNDLSPFILPGVFDLLQELQSMKGIYLALATGTSGPTADILLDRSNLRSHFPVAAYGHECDTRPELIRLALYRAIRFYNLDGEDVRVITIGDAPSDIEAGKAIGAYTVAVASGRISNEELRQYKPDLILDSLSDAGSAIISLLRT